MVHTNSCAQLPRRRHQLFNPGDGSTILFPAQLIQVRRRDEPTHTVHNLRRAGELSFDAGVQHKRTPLTWPELCVGELRQELAAKASLRTALLCTAESFCITCQLLEELSVLASSVSLDTLPERWHPRGATWHRLRWRELDGLPIDGASGRVKRRRLAHAMQLQHDFQLALHTGDDSVERRLRQITDTTKKTKGICQSNGTHLSPAFSATSNSGRPTTILAFLQFEDGLSWNRSTIESTSWLTCLRNVFVCPTYTRLANKQQRRCLVKFRDQLSCFPNWNVAVSQRRVTNTWNSWLTAASAQRDDVSTVDVQGPHCSSGSVSMVPRNHVLMSDQAYDNTIAGNWERSTLVLNTLGKSGMIT